MINLTQVANFAKTNETARFNKAAQSQSPIAPNAPKLAPQLARDAFQPSFGMARVTTLPQKNDAANELQIKIDTLKKDPDKFYDFLMNDKQAEKEIFTAANNIAGVYNKFIDFNRNNQKELFDFIKLIEKDPDQKKANVGGRILDNFGGLSNLKYNSWNTEKLNSYQEGLREGLDDIRGLYYITCKEKPSVKLAMNSLIYKELNEGSKILNKDVPIFQVYVDSIRELITKSDLSPEKSYNLLSAFKGILNDKDKFDVDYISKALKAQYKAEKNEKEAKDAKSAPEYNI